MQNPYLLVDRLTKQYPGQASAAVSNLSFQLAPGTILGFLGPNGAGKTTTIKMIAGLVLPTSGRVEILGHDVGRERRAAVHHVGAVLEGARNLYWRLSAWDNLLYFGSIRLVPDPVLRERAADLLQLLGLEKDRDREVRHFSRGMQQKLAIVTALLHEPELLLLDEPTLGLDVQAAKTVEAFILHLARERGKAILITTHQLDLAERVADEIFVIHQGESVAYEKTAQLLKSFPLQRQTVEIHLDTPLTQPDIEQLKSRHSALITTMNGNGLVTLHLPAQDQSELITILDTLTRSGARIATVAYRRANLEEVFLSLTETRQP
jgi:ABC-2 type transport system ATP-binding protein